MLLTNSRTQADSESCVRTGSLNKLSCIFTKTEPFLSWGYMPISASLYACVIWLPACKRATSGKQAEGWEPECVWIPTTACKPRCSCLNSAVGKWTIAPVRLPRHAFIILLIHGFMYLDNHFLALNNDFLCFRRPSDLKSTKESKKGPWSERFRDLLFS